MRKFVAFVTVIVFFHSIAGIISSATGSEGIPARKGRVTALKMTGEVVSVDTANKAVIIRGNKGETVFIVDDKTKVVVGKEERALADLKPGDRVTIQYTTVNVAQKIVNLTGARSKGSGKASVMQTAGEVVSVDSAAKTVTIKGKKGSMTFTVDDKTRIVRGQKRKTLADLQPGDKLKVKYTEVGGKNVAQKMTVSTARKGKRQPR
jgi:hypothetical protein